MSEIIKLKITATSEDGSKSFTWTESHKDWALNEVLNVLAQVNKEYHPQVTSVICEDEEGNTWEDDLQDYDFSKFRREHEKTHECTISWGKWWGDMIYHYKAMITHGLM